MAITSETVPTDEESSTSAGAPRVSTNRRVIADGETDAALPTAVGLPRGLSAPSATAPAGETLSSEPSAASPALPEEIGTHCSGWLNSALREAIPSVRQSPAPDTTAKSKVWLQCCNWKLEPSGALRAGGSIQVPDGHPVQDRISEVCRVPSASTAKPGTPRLSTATVRSSKAPHPAGASWSTMISASPRSSTNSSTAPATMSTGRASTPRRSASGRHTASNGANAGTNTRTRPLASWRLTSAAYAGSAAASTAAVKAFSAGPPRAMRASGRLESTSRWP